MVTEVRLGRSPGQIPAHPQLPGRVGVSVSQAGVVEAPGRPHKVSLGSVSVGAPAHPATPVQPLPTTLLILSPASLPRF